MIKSILIYGSYGGGNYGDEIILDALLQSLKAEDNITVLVPGDQDKVSKMHDVNTIPLWSAPPQKTLPGKLSKFFRSILMLNRNLKIYDIILIGGGNIIMDLFPKSPLITFSLCCLAKLHHKKICFIGCGAGPIYRITSKLLFKASFKMADLITLRDGASYKLVKSLCPSNKNIFECADLMFSNNYYFNKAFNLIDQQKIEYIAINIVAYNKPRYYPNANEEKYGDYCSFIEDTINYLISQAYLKEILLFTTSHPYDDCTLKDIESRMGSRQDNKIIFGCKYASFTELSEILKKYDLIITSRLHSLFLSICLNKKVIPLIYQEKVQNFVYENNMDSISIDIREISPESFYKFKLIFKKIKENPIYYSDIISSVKTKQIAKSKKNFELFRMKMLSKR